jgi:lysophospholipase L1-like esterase
MITVSRSFGPEIKAIGKQLHAPVLDLYELFRGRSDLFPDKIHPNEQGAMQIANEVHLAITSRVVE